MGRVSARDHQPVPIHCDDGGVDDIALLTLYEVSDLAFVPAPIVLTGLRFRHRSVHAVAAAL